MYSLRRMNKKHVVNKLNKSQENVKEISDFYAYDIYTDIHMNESNNLEKEIECAKNLFSKRFRKAKNVQEIKAKLLEMSLRERKITTPINLTSKYRLILNNTYSKTPDNSQLNLNNSMTKSLDSPYFYRTPHKKVTNLRYSSFTINNLRKNNTPIENRLRYMNYHRTPINKANQLMEIVETTKSVKKAQKNKATIHKYITELNKIIHKDELPEFKLQTEKMKKTFILHNDRVIEDFAFDRKNRTKSILESIDVSRMSIIKPLYNYKLKSVLSHEEEVYELKDKLHKMLEDPKRMVARIEKGIAARKRIRSILFNKKKVRTQFAQT